MSALSRLPLRAVDIATAPTRFAVKTMLRFLRDDGGHAAEGGGSAGAPAFEAPAPHNEQRAATRARSRRRPRARTRVARGQRITRPPQPRGGPGPEIHVAEPWKGYDAMTEDEVLERLIGADPTLRAAVRLYESTHGGRRQVLIATEEPIAQP